MNEEEAIEICKDIRDKEDYFGHLAIETVLNLLEKKNITIIETKEANRQLSVELQKKDKMIDEMAKGIYIEIDKYKNPEEVKQYYERKVENGN